MTVPGTTIRAVAMGRSRKRAATWWRICFVMGFKPGARDELTVGATHVSKRRRAATSSKDKTPLARKERAVLSPFTRAQAGGAAFHSLYCTGAGCCCPRNRPGGCPTDLRTMALKALAL